MEYCLKQSEAKEDYLPCEIGREVPPNVTENRRSANYKPNIWKYDFLQSLTSKYDNEKFGTRMEKLISKARFLFVQEMGVLPKLELVAAIQDLGLANLFEDEINEALETIVSVKNSISSVDENLYSAALCFRLHRQHGYEVSPDKLGKFLAGKGAVSKKISFSGDVKQMIELLKASHLAFEGEHILDEAEIFASNSLMNASTKLHSDLAEQVVHALELPFNWRVRWFDVKWHIKEYEKKHVNSSLLELAKLNFNMIQAKLQKEVKELSRWWKNLGLEKDLNFARDRLVESFMCAAGVASEPKFRSLRKWLTKLITFVLVIDDVYDVYASFEELKQFTIAVDRWDAKELQQLPECMRVCFQALNDVTIEIACEIAGEHNIDMVLPYIKKEWINFCKALYVEAKWYKEGYTPSLEEYLNNAWISSSGPVILLHAYFATTHQQTDQIDDFLQKNQELIYNISLIIRLCNDLGTTVAERERGDAASAILCYMNQMDVSEEAAREHIEYMIQRAWKKINEHCFSHVASSQSFVTKATNAARVAHILYQNNRDGFGTQDGDVKRQILSLIIEPFLEV